MRTARPETEAYVAILRTAERLSLESVQVLKAYGISAVQYNVLRILRGAQPEGLSCTEIANRMINRDPDITRLIDRMESHGWVRRERQAKDRRVVLVYISQVALELLAGLDRPIADLHILQFKKVGPQGARELVRLLGLCGQ
jgi:DNA-binding MarR family transcriptional regulator